MDYNKLSKNIVTKIGGTKNIVNVTHCATRLRFTLKDEQIVEDKEIKNLDKVLGIVKAGGQYQIIIGNDVKKVYKEVCEILNSKNNENLEEKFEGIKNKNKERLFNRISRTLMKIIFPVVPTMAAVAILKGLVSILLMAGILNAKDGTYIILTSINDAFLYFLPIIIAISVSKTFGSNTYIAMTIGSVLVFPSIVELYEKGTDVSFLGIPVILNLYGNSIFPIIISTIIAAQLEKKLEKFIPEFLEFLKIMITLLIMVPITFLVIGPVFTIFSELLASGTMAVFSFSPIITGIIFGAFWQLFVLMGLHYAFIPVITDITLRLGENSFNPILAMGVWALAGTSLGYALKARKKDEKSIGYTAMTSALFGITEPAIFGIALPNRRAFASAMIAGGIAGPLCIVFGTTQYSPAVVGGILTFGAHMNPSGDPQSLIGYFVTFFVSFIISALLTYWTVKVEK